MLDRSHVGMLVTNAVGQIVWINAVLEAYLGVQKAEVLGLDKRAFTRDYLSRVVADPAPLVAGALGTSWDETHALVRLLGTAARAPRRLEYWACRLHTGAFAGGRIEYYVDVTHRPQPEPRRRSPGAPHGRRLYLVKGLRSA